MRADVLLRQNISKMRLTEAIRYLNMEREPSQRWIDTHFYHFTPSWKDREARVQYQKMLEEKDTPKKMVMKELE